MPVARKQAKEGSVLALQANTLLKLLTSLRRGDILRFMSADPKQDGIHVTPRRTEHITGKRLIIEWSPELQQAVARTRDRSILRSGCSVLAGQVLLRRVQGDSEQLGLDVAAIHGARASGDQDGRAVH